MPAHCLFVLGKHSVAEVPTVHCSLRFQLTQPAYFAKIGGMFQYRLSTLFLIFFVVATTMAVFGVIGMNIAAMLLYAAFCLNRTVRLTTGIVLASLFLFAGIVYPGWLFLLESRRSMPFLNWYTTSEQVALLTSMMFHSGSWPLILAAIVWLISIALLFYRAVKSRRKPEIEAVKPQTPS